MPPFTANTVLTTDDVMRITDLELLEGMKEILSTPDDWHQGDLVYRDEETYAPVSFCLLGAARAAVLGKDNADEGTSAGALVDMRCMNLLAYCVPEAHRKQRQDYHKSLYTHLPVGFADYFAEVADFNDNESTTYEDIIAAINCAIEKTKTKETVNA